MSDMATGGNRKQLSQTSYRSMIQRYEAYGCRSSISGAFSDYFQCYLCPGNPRAAGETNPNYEKTFAFVNDYSAVKEQQPDYEAKETSNGKSGNFPSELETDLA